MQRPTSVTVFGILNIVFGLFGIFGALFSMVMLRMADPETNPMMRIMRDNPSYALWVKISVILGVAASVVLLVSGIGLLKLRPWGRVASLGYAIYYIVVGILSLGINFVLVFRPLMEEAQRSQGPEAVGAIAGAIGGTVGGCIGMIYPILLLYFMTRPKVVAAFGAPAQEPASPPV